MRLTEVNQNGNNYCESVTHPESGDSVPRGCRFYIVSFVMFYVMIFQVSIKNLITFRNYDSNKQNKTYNKIILHIILFLEHSFKNISVPT